MDQLKKLDVDYFDSHRVWQVIAKNTEQRIEMIDEILTRRHETFSVLFYITPTPADHEEPITKLSKFAKVTTIFSSSALKKIPEMISNAQHKNNMLVVVDDCMFPKFNDENWEAFYRIMRYSRHYHTTVFLSTAHFSTHCLHIYLELPTYFLIDGKSCSNKDLSRISNKILTDNKELNKVKALKTVLDQIGNGIFVIQNHDFVLGWLPIEMIQEEGECGGEEEEEGREEEE